MLLKKQTKVSLNYLYHPFRLQIIHLQSEKEEEIYKNAIAKDEIVLYRAYLEQFENGKYKTFINKALHNALEKQAYQEARSINTSIQYEQYLAKQPNSRYVGEILLLYEITLRAEAAQAIQEKDCKKAELCYASYTKYFPNSMHIRLSKAEVANMLF